MKTKPSTDERVMIEALAKLPASADGLRVALGCVSAWAWRVSLDEGSNDRRVLDAVDVLLATIHMLESDGPRHELTAAVGRLARDHKLATLADVEVTTKSYVAMRMVEELTRYPKAGVGTVDDLAGMLVAWSHPLLVRLGLTSMTRQEARAALAKVLPGLIRRRDDARDIDAERIAAACLRRMGLPTKQADAFIRSAADARASRDV